MKKFGRIFIITLIITALPAFSVGNADNNENQSVQAIPGGETVGLKLYLDGLLVVGFSDIPGSVKVPSPGKSAGIQKGDRITHVNGKKISNIRDFSQKIQESGGNKLSLRVARDDNIFEKKVMPIYYNDVGQYKIGIWVRDSAAGIGTVTFMLDDGSFAALGHGISDADAEEMITISSGEVTGSNITSVMKGQEGAPGELRGVFDNSASGEVYTNTEAGIFGHLTKHNLSDKPMEIEKEENVSEGSAVILSNISGNKIEEFQIEVERVMRFNNSDGKCMVIKVTDPSLLERTGGIVQGMSGSPIIKDGKIIGAVTHVFLNDPTQGYAIFADRMLKNIKK